MSGLTHDSTLNHTSIVSDNGKQNERRMVAKSKPFMVSREKQSSKNEEEKTSTQ